MTAEPGQRVEAEAIGVHVGRQGRVPPTVAASATELLVHTSGEVDRAVALRDKLLGDLAQRRQLLAGQDRGLVSRVIRQRTPGQDAAGSLARSFRRDDSTGAQRNFRRCTGAIMPEGLDRGGYLLSALDRQKVGCIRDRHEPRRRVGGPVEEALRGFTQVTVLGAGHDERRHRQGPDLRGPVFATAPLQPGAPSQRIRAPHIRYRGRHVRLGERAGRVGLDELARRLLAQVAARRPADHRLAAVLGHRFGRHGRCGQQCNAGEAEKGRPTRQSPRGDDRGDFSAHAVADDYPPRGTTSTDPASDELDRLLHRGPDDPRRVTEPGQIDGDHLDLISQGIPKVSELGRTRAQSVKAERHRPCARPGAVA